MSSFLTNFCYTKHGLYDADDEEAWTEGAEGWIKKWETLAKYHVFQLERCPTSQRLHYQGYIQLKRQQRFSAIKKVDKDMHFEAQKARSNEKAAEYCKKTDTFVAGPWEEGQMKRSVPPNGEGRRSRAADDDFAEAFNAPTVAEGISILRQKRPRDVAMHGEAIERNLKRAKLTVFKPLYSLDTYSLEPQEFTKSTLIHGPSGVGKTQYALSHFKNPLVVSHIDKLKELSPDHDGIVFDDMSFTHHPPESVIHLLDVDLDREIHVRYGVVTIPANTVKVFVHNKANPFYDVEKVVKSQQDAIERRLNRVEIVDKCYIEL